MAAGKLGRGAPEGLGLGMEITGGVVGHDNAAEKDRDDAGELHRLRQNPGHVREEDEQYRFQRLELRGLRAGLVSVRLGCRFDA